ncbi:HD domain-containing protein [Sporosarcina sp. ANT_H38]|uniref:HD domain-containing protein n=1 Tax=Sporosarcina sp. ANT_H38 TaxID=2597358 RepID=UPI0011F2618C|nr:HD domain-containing protein [Sporosarcina sp. ANT_H38]KAA0966090.1 HD domain-containing protein [Sporosarcina sp. ANT_H38]
MIEMIEKCKQIVVEIYNKFDASHDFAHIERVMNNAEKILDKEPSASEEVVRFAVLLHDIEDAKYKSDDNPSVLEILQAIGVNDELSEKVLACIESVSFSGGNALDIKSIDGAIVRDADRLDAIGAVGIARTFAFGGARGRKLYDTDEMVRNNMSEIEYRSKETASVTHFYEKLLLLKDLMVTEEGKRLAEQRHDYMEGFLKQLDREIGS